MFKSNFMSLVKFIINEKGERISAVLPIKKYEQLLKKAEQFEDIIAYDKAMRRKHVFIPLDVAMREMQSVKKKTR